MTSPTGITQAELDYRDLRIGRLTLSLEQALAQRDQAQRAATRLGAENEALQASIAERDQVILDLADDDEDDQQDDDEEDEEE